MPDLKTAFQSAEGWLLARVLATAKAPPRYLSALEEVWHQSFQGLTSALVATLDAGERSMPGLGTDAPEDPAVAFGNVEALRHRERGVSLDMSIELLKLYRPAYLDLVRASLEDRTGAEALLPQVDRFFDRVEVGFCRTWAQAAEKGGVKDLEERNLELGLERDRYVTIFESLPVPILLLDPDLSVRNMNHAASLLFFGCGTPGAWYYQHGARPAAEAMTGLFPAGFARLAEFTAAGLDRQEQEWVATPHGRPLTFRVLISRMLDLPSTFAGILVILDDLTERVEAARERERLIAELTRTLAEVRQLSGLLPICAWCKKIRDDKGYWAQLESYLASHAGVAFSHSVCPDCAAKLRSELRATMSGGDLSEGSGLA
ncbi:MAG TPA: PAS domain-containing protein [Holophaga sp.]|nr:PAS domain-containing protein [Holophaga sp.]